MYTRKFEIVSKKEEIRYKICLTSSLDVVRFLIEQGDAFRAYDESNTSLAAFCGHDESDTSLPSARVI